MSPQSEENSEKIKAFIGRASSWLLGGAILLMVLVVIRHLSDSGTPERLTLRNADAETVAKLQWGSLLLITAVWTLIAYSFWSLGKYKEWARKATICVFAVLAFSFTWNGFFTLLMSAGVLDIEFASTQDLEWSLRIVIVLLGIGLLILAWLCWMLIRKLRTQEVRAVFLA
jgi:hypothetical protein